MIPQYESFALAPGQLAELESIAQNQFWWGDIQQQTVIPALISGASRDTGNTVTTVLRGGLLLGQVHATKKLVPWAPTAVDGSQYVAAILASDMNAQVGGVDKDRYWSVFYAGKVKSSKLIIPGQATESLIGKDYEWAAAIQLLGRVIFDQHPLQFGRHINIANVAGDAMTLTAADHGAFITDDGEDAATTITLPAPLPGLEYTFFSLTALNRTIAFAGADNVVGTAADQDTVTLEDIGDMAQLRGLSTTKWGLVASQGSPALA